MAMMEVKDEPAPEQEPRLFVTIGNEQPISAEDLGRLIRELGADYRRLTGFRVVLVRLELGSTILELLDQAVIYTAYVGAPLVIMDAAERMGQFYKFLKEQLRGPAFTQALLPPLDSSPARLLEIAANSRANLEIRRGTGKSKEVIKLTHTEVSARYADAKTRKKNRGKSKTWLAASETPLQIGHLSERLRAQAAAAPEHMENLVELFVEFLKSNGTEDQLPALAQDLDSHHLYDMAAVVRRHINKGKGDDLVKVRRD